MEQLAFLPDLASLPKAADAERAVRGIEQWLEAVERAADPALMDFARGLTDSGPGKALLTAIVGNSPYLTRVILNDLHYFQDLLRRGPGDCCDAALAEMRRYALPLTTKDGARTATIDEVMAGLRIAKSRAALAIAVADIAGAWPLERITGALSDMAEQIGRASCRERVCQYV